MSEREGKKGNCLPCTLAVVVVTVLEDVFASASSIEEADLVVSLRCGVTVVVAVVVMVVIEVVVVVTEVVLVVMEEAVAVIELVVVVVLVVAKAFNKNKR